MEVEKASLVLLEKIERQSSCLQRKVKLDYYLPQYFSSLQLNTILLINDGQDLGTIGFLEMLNGLYEKHLIKPLLVVGIHAGAARKMEYGTASLPDYKGRGAKAAAYTSFIMEELIACICDEFNLPSDCEKAFAGFSLGALSALDIVWNHPGQFSMAGVFSGSLWWRRKDCHDPSYDDNKDRIMHQQIRAGEFHPGTRFFFEVGQQDEQEDRNQNGVIDSIDDTLDLIHELKAKGYTEDHIEFLLLNDGRHNIETWGRALPAFLMWGFGRSLTGG